MNMKIFFLVGMILLFTTDSLFAKAGTLLKCEPVSTQTGYKYIGTYCVDYECKFVVRKIFDEYCPYLIPED